MSCILNINSLLFHQKKYIFNEVIKFMGETKSSFRNQGCIVLYSHDCR